MSNAKGLKELGLTNSDSESYGAIAGCSYKIKIPIAFCESHKCCSDEAGQRAAPRLRKDANKNATFCKDCGSALIWKLMFFSREKEG